MPQAGLEPALLSEQDFESSASTNSTTGATAVAYNVVLKTRNGKSAIEGISPTSRPYLAPCSMLSRNIRSISLTLLPAFLRWLCHKAV